MNFPNPADTQIFAFYAGAAGLLAAVGLMRDSRSRVAAPAGREGLLAPLGLAALAVAMMLSVAAPVRLLAGALLLAGLALLAVAPRRPDRPSPGRQVGATLAYAAIAVALIGAFIPLTATPSLST
ncbi:hypothetical protein sos41_34280 [Alphaproteobacteria bacterium SO-S41]|nr:hypothetical protein sos41_34280 [Alphaproteobacteria bacterium SO-S41]